ncbi:Dor1-like protein [Niveomyces insectorum RCEF 264]|uniref:Conserved oligomeric Golgi complex subunit 8 n=1 Tax=Niveomyces insectorum RCEF 264 TaxID=1081102 RepID=A0A167XUF2_9HYPO|nr:Dor1-like protein [Niveomyces insectorum RCEF 264]
MADLLYDLLVASSATAPGPDGAPYHTGAAAGVDASASFADAAHADAHARADALAYLASVAAKPLASLQADEPRALAHSAHALQLSLQGLAKKSYQPVLDAAQRHAALRAAVPKLAASTATLRQAIPALDDEVVRFSTTYRGGRRSGSGGGGGGGGGGTKQPTTKTATTTAAVPPPTADTLLRRRQALLLARNVERLVDADASLRATAASLVLALKAPGLKLAAALRTIGWLRRVLPDLEAAAAAADTASSSQPSPSFLSSPNTQPQHPPTPRDTAAQERVLGALFLVCRLATLTTMLDALAPLRALADQDQARAERSPSAAAAAAANATAGTGHHAWAGGQQTERYLKRYLEIFREQSFAIVSMFRSIFPTVALGPAEPAAPTPRSPLAPSLDGHTSSIFTSTAAPLPGSDDPLEPLPSALATFPLHLVDRLLATLRRYLPTVRDQAARDSLLTQVLYCAGSLGRLGGDFGLFLATLDVGTDAEAEWAEVVRRHRQLAGRLESIVGEPKDKR